MKHIGQPRLRRALMPLAVALAVSEMAGQAYAQEAAPAEPVQSVVVTGSLIRRVADEGATPLMTIKATELESRGHTELKDLVLEQPQSLSLGTNSGAAGPMTNLRGLGPMRTLTLLNGRRLANEPLQDQYVSVNVIPRMALDRVETLPGGAASIYGADAIGGVQNFWTKRGYKGISLKAEYATPEMSGGGDTKSFGAIAGWGNLASDGWNAYIAVDHQKKTALFQADRPEQHDPDVLRTLGLGLLPDARNASPLANFGFTRSANSNYNPTYASGCLEPYARPTLGNQSANNPPVYAPGCYRNPLYYNAVTDGSKITNVAGRASFNLPGGHKIDVDVLHSNFTVQKFRGMQVPGTTNPFTTYSLPASSRFYPGNGITPAVQVVGSNTGSNTPTMYIDPTKTPGAVSNLNMNGRTVYFQWGPAELGPAYRNDEQTNDRIVVTAEGEVLGWDYRAGLNWGMSKRDTRVGGGYLLYSKAQEGFDKGILNPFGLQDEAGLEYLRGIEARDYTYRLNKAYNKSVDVTLSKGLWTLPGGDLTLALAGELRRDAARTYDAPLDYVYKNADGSYKLDAAGNVLQHDLVGETPQGVGRRLHRDIASLLAEVDAPITSTFLLNGAIRGDYYEDLKQTTWNPKLAARWQPIPSLLLRSSISTGFRAPSIMDVQNPTAEVRTIDMDDPVLCPSAQPTVSGTGTPVPGYTADQVCNVNTEYWTKTPDNSFLKPEKSRGFSFGFGYEPIKNLSLTVDYWGLKIKDVLGAVTIAEIQQDPAKYASFIMRRADGTIDHIVASQANRGMSRVRGADISASYRFPAQTWGTVDAKIDATWYHKYEFQSEKDGPWYSNIGIITNDGRYGGAGPNAGLAGMPQINPRWKYTASLGWGLGPWKATLSQRFQTGLTDLTPRTGSTLTKVDSYSQYNVNVRYTGIKNTTVSLGVNNITEEWPPLTANSIYSGGYITSMADMMGRVYRLSVEYKF
ncbi:iron complex outermembrane receptor protein [Pseudoduganella flava]|uniref:Iron complex outermembrane receptor protein n=1 Tax=Pseudoduganella flava TaxID=871742 RepID=A0A562PKI8_9BURK|nr:TonB-dependent receptor [Pseudoduganella flava]QGZ42409.1 TonB-dependent receptor plug domain-containing protein [Pseudoduganella flava]TWI44971.1 iron complex outermembrane receptor protein [Pseudoduganella flava]